MPPTIVAIRPGRGKAQQPTKRPSPPRPPRPDLDPDDPDNLESLRRALALARENLAIVLDGEGGKRPLRVAYALVEELGGLHRRLEPRRYGREAGRQP